MAPQSATGKRVKGVQVYRPFIYGTTARPFDPVHNPKPPGVPDDHTHSWEVFVRGIDDTDITYWLRRVQFKLHESIPNHVRMVEGERGKPFVVRETGWGEFEISIKLYYAAESGEKPQTLYHHLRLHPYASNAPTAAPAAADGAANGNAAAGGAGGTTSATQSVTKHPGEVIAWVYEEQLFNEPFEAFYDMLTSPAPAASAAGGKGKGGKGGKGGATGTGTTGAGAALQGERTPGGVLERSAMVPLTSRPGHPFSKEAEQLEIKRIREAHAKTEEMTRKMVEELRAKEAELKKLKEENKAATAA